MTVRCPGKGTDRAQLRARRTPLRALRAHCLWCCLGSFEAVRNCPSVGCALWPWRMGRADGEARPPSTVADGLSAGIVTGRVEGE